MFQNKRFVGTLAFLFVCFIGMFIILARPWKPDKHKTIIDLPYAVVDGNPIKITDTYPISSEKTDQLKGKWLPYNNTNFVSKIVIDPSGNIWTVGTGGVIRWNRNEETFTHYTPADGLPENIIRAIAIDPSGTLWVGSAGGGLSKFDGSGWITEDEVLGDTITDLAFAEDGALWVGTNAGVAYRAGEDMQWEIFTTQNGLPDNYIHSIEITSTHTVWVGAAGGAAYLDGNAWISQYFPVGTVVNDIVEAPDHSLWFGTNKGLYFSNGQKWFHYSSSENTTLNFVSSIAFSSKGDGWAVGPNTGLNHFRLDSNRITRYLFPDLSYVVVDSDGSPWIGSFTGGFFHGNHNTYEQYLSVDGRASNYATAGTVDSDGRLWFGTGSGINRYDGQNWETFTKSDGLLGDNARSIAASENGSVWLQMDYGLTRWENGIWNTYPKSDDLYTNYLSSIVAASDGAVWYMDYRGLNRFDGSYRNLYTVPFTLPNNPDYPGPDYPIVAASDGSIWIAPLNGNILRFYQQAWTSIPRPFQDQITCIAFSPQNDLWIGTDRSGFAVLNKKSWEDAVSAENLVDSIQWKILNDLQMTSPNRVNAITFDAKNEAWIGTNHGVIHIDHNDLYTKFTTQDGLGDDYVQVVVVDHHGSIWAVTPLGGISNYVPLY